MSLQSSRPDPPAPHPPTTPLLTVDQFMRTVLAAILDTPVARRELAALFLAASAAWEVAVREHGCRRAPPAPSSSSARAPRARPRAEPDAEQRALAAFCTHAGVVCAGCGGWRPIEGPRYVCARCCAPPRSLCAACRRSGAACGGAGECRFVVYDHPWEADAEYAPGNPYAPVDVFKVPRAPMRIGDEGPRVMHLHYVLYKMGYLRLANEGLRVGFFCEETKQTVARFQRDHLLIADSAATGSASTAPVTVRRPNSPVSIPMPVVAQAARPASPALATSPALITTPVTGADRNPQESQEEISFQQPWGQVRDQPGVFTALTRLTILNIVNEVESRYSQLRCREAETTRRTHFQAATAA